MYLLYITSSANLSSPFPYQQGYSLGCWPYFPRLNFAFISILYPLSIHQGLLKFSWSIFSFCCIPNYVLNLFLQFDSRNARWKSLPLKIHAKGLGSIISLFLKCTCTTLWYLERLLGDNDVTLITLYYFLTKTQHT